MERLEWIGGPPLVFDLDVWVRMAAHVLRGLETDWLLGFGCALPNKVGPYGFGSVASFDFTDVVVGDDLDLLAHRLKVVLLGGLVPRCSRRAHSEQDVEKLLSPDLFGLVV